VDLPTIVCTYILRAITLLRFYQLILLLLLALVYVLKKTTILNFGWPKVN
jgi:hypothetical protein